MNTELFPVLPFRAGARLSSVLVFATAVALAGCTSKSGPGQSDTEVTGTTAVSFEEWQKTVYQDPDTGTWVVDGDTPIASATELRSFFETYVQQGALIVDMYNGVINRWHPQTAHNLVYCVDRVSFGANYGRVVQAIRAAAAEWAQVASVRFLHHVAQDDNCTLNNEQVLFNVRQSGQGFSGLAFFPHYPRSHRFLNISAVAATYGRNPNGPETLVGLFRHELGHILGFRHEHIHPEAHPAQSHCEERGAWKAVTIYDSNSVMHYPWCNGTNKGDLRITALDVQGAVALYGKP
ncbi:M57 family metalloprotease [Pendulispora rubella]|uniref:M57 family metalloprotease n=1 Tax=Pendulispora rubella TaxID=2741070 RepID=A0ABZ2KS63_9BACT